jgi:hypothetical protein
MDALLAGAAAAAVSATALPPAMAVAAMITSLRLWLVIEAFLPAWCIRREDIR